MPEQTEPGSLTTSGEMYFLPERSSYRASRVLARRIALEIADRLKTGQPVVVADLSFLNDLGNLSAVQRQMDGLLADYQGLTALSPAGNTLGSTNRSATNSRAMSVLPGFSSFLPAALGVLGVLKEDVEYTGIRTVVDPLAFRIAVASAVGKNNPQHRVYIPDLISPQSNNGVVGIAGQLRLIHQARAQAWRSMAPQMQSLAQKNAELDRASRAGNQHEVNRLAAQIARLRADLDPVSRPLEEADRRLGDLEASLFAEATGKLTLMARLLRAEAIQGMNPQILHASVVSSGGHNRISRHLLRIAFLGDGLGWMGGAVARWALLEPDGAIVVGGIVDQTCKGSTWREFWRFTGSPCD